MPKSETLTFEGIPAGTGTDIADGYGGLYWHDFGAANSTDYPMSGVSAGCTSGTNVAYSDGSDPADVSLNGTFTLKSVELTAAFDKKLTVDVYGYNEGTQVFHTTVTLTDKAPDLVKVDFKGVDDVEFVGSGGKPDHSSAYNGDNIIFDDMVISNIVNASPRVHSDANPQTLPFTGNHAAVVDLLSHFGVHGDLTSAGSHCLV